VNRDLLLLDALSRESGDAFTLVAARDILQISSEATSNVLRRLRGEGLVERVSRGHYVIRPFGSLGASVVYESLPKAVASVFEEGTYRIAYLSALGELGLLQHPVPGIFVASTRQVRRQCLGSRRLRIVRERPTTIDLGSEMVDGAHCSSVERALVEGAHRVDLAGGAQRLCEAMVAATPTARTREIERIAAALGTRGQVALRRLASLSSALDLTFDFAPLTRRPTSIIRLDPSDAHFEWMDEHYKVSWNLKISEMRATVMN
jgi:predicted transcriptional regulator of viral defense system